jgi:hypothetical protein
MVCLAKRRARHETRRTNPSLRARDVGWLVRAGMGLGASSQLHEQAIRCTSGHMDRMLTAANSSGATGWAVRPATRPSVQRAAELVCGPLGWREGTYR